MCYNRGYSAWPFNLFRRGYSHRSSAHFSISRTVKAQCMGR